MVAHGRACYLLHRSKSQPLRHRDASEKKRTDAGQRLASGLLPRRSCRVASDLRSAPDGRRSLWKPIVAQTPRVGDVVYMWLEVTYVAILDATSGATHPLLSCELSCSWYGRDNGTRAILRETQGLIPQSSRG